MKTKTVLKEKVLYYIKKGEELEKTENTTPGMPVKVISGPGYETWMNEIQIFNERHLKTHPLYNSINTTCFHRKNINAFSDMMGHLKALANDTEFFNVFEENREESSFERMKTIDQLLAEDIERCRQYLAQPNDDLVGQTLYIEITARYDDVIAGFGNGLYQYYAAEHFYDSDITGETLIHNIRKLQSKMIAYQATHVSTEMDAGKKNISTMYDVFISHANADKIDYVDQLKESLDKLKISIFYDKDTLEWGDKWKDKILEGVGKAEFAIIVISNNFFGREWTEKELKEFLNRQNTGGQKVILPILYNITTEQLKEKYPSVADIQALDASKCSCDEIALKFAGQLIKRLRE